ncbi:MULTISPECIES: PadR family transcriptional regulator [unclassified Microbacterium]|uniref:PadR family transcriptional regulator n=1 Tax=unclassified Microbacterium TaxID=2609290 RepID=UPI001E40A222|nr:PadR family transcriptional regulator [Microbacterium sp. Au-Mic1]MCE4026778.1 PadR family transcriptional regulator [Microbacterium sp. Au-Mic1]
MDNSYASRGFGGPGFGPGGGRGFGGRPGMNPTAGLWEAMEHLRSAFEQRPTTTPRMARGDVRTAVLALLAEQPMHGYQIIQEIEERSGGSWKPSAGSVYPTLQLLADEGLIEAAEQGGRKTYSLTEAGRAVADEAGAPPWEGARGGAPFGGPFGGQFGALPKAGVDLAGAAAQVARTGTPEQVQQAIEVLDDARRKLYAILAD